MYYLLNPDIALRSWQRAPYAYYRKHVRNAGRLTAEEFSLLSQCDAQHDLADSAVLDRLLRRGFITACARGAGTLSPWQMRTCDNRYCPAMNWMITGKCNYNCLHCFNASDNRALMSEFSMEEAERLLDEAEMCGIHAITITGGEPMCHPNFFEIAEGILRRGMYVEELNTNGYYISAEALQRLRTLGCDPLIKISFDGIGHHDWLRNRAGAQEDALRAIRLCIEYGFRVKVQTNVHRRNIDAMPETAQMLDALGVNEMRIIRTTEVPRWNRNAGDATLGLDEYYDGMLAFAETYAGEEHRMDIDIWQFLTMHPSRRTYRMRPVECGIGEYRDTLPVCRGNRGMIAVAANGNVFPCMQVSGYYEAKHDIPGNVKRDGLQTILQEGRYLDEVCTTLGDLAAANETCRNCRYFVHCAGGCRAIALTLTGDKLGVDPAKCLFFQGGYPEKIAQTLDGWTDLLPMAF